jgi:hypothetical protein
VSKKSEKIHRSSRRIRLSLTWVSNFSDRQFLNIRWKCKNGVWGSHCSSCALFLRYKFKFQFLDQRPIQWYAYVLNCALQLTSSKALLVCWIFFHSAEIRRFSWVQLLNFFHDYDSSKTKEYFDIKLSRA